MTRRFHFMPIHFIPTVRFQFEPRDLWIGVFWRVNYDWVVRLQVYICLLPCFPILLSFSQRERSRSPIAYNRARMT